MHKKTLPFWKGFYQNGRGLCHVQPQQKFLNRKCTEEKRKDAKFWVKYSLGVSASDVLCLCTCIFCGKMGFAVNWYRDGIAMLLSTRYKRAQVLKLALRFFAKLGGKTLKSDKLLDLLVGKLNRIFFD